MNFGNCGLDVGSAADPYTTSRLTGGGVSSLNLTASGQHVGFVADKAAMGQVFSKYFGFPCQLSFHQFLHHHILPGLAQ
jgi:hypothetical protein